jgi:hypothetical protein
LVERGGSALGKRSSLPFARYPSRPCPGGGTTCDCHPMRSFDRPTYSPSRLTRCQPRSGLAHRHRRSFLGTRGRVWCLLGSSGTSRYLTADPFGRCPSISFTGKFGSRQRALRIDGSREPEVDLAIYRVTEEAGRNAVAHSFGSPVHLSGFIAPDAIEIEVRDDGRSLDQGALERAYPTGHAGIRRRIGQIGLPRRPAIGSLPIPVWPIGLWLETGPQFRKFSVLELTHEVCQATSPWSGPEAHESRRIRAVEFELESDRQGGPPRTGSTDDALSLVWWC